MGKKKLTKQGIIKAWKQLDSKSKKPVGLKALCAKMGIKSYHVLQLFKGESLTDVKLRHGIRLSPPETPYTPDQLLKKYDTVVSKGKKIPSWNKVKFDSGIPDSTFKKHFNKTHNTKRDLGEAYYKWLKKNKPRSQNLKVVEQYLRGEDKPDVPPATKTKTSNTKPHVSQKTGGRTYGRLLGYENLVYEPANEQGVVVLFAMMSKHLQYNIEGVWQDSFPDCEAMRVESGGSLRRVRIEFEYKSKEFVAHGHNPNECDVLVCWKDNWKDCPQNIEVLELSKKVQQIKSEKK